MSKSVERYGLSYIRPYHREIARRLVLGQTQAEISRELGITEGRLSIIRHSPLFKIELKRLERLRDEGVADIGKTLKELSPIALEQIERTLYQAPSWRLRFDAAKDVLDRAGHGAVNKSIVGVVDPSRDYSSLTEDELRKMVRERVERMHKSIEEKAQAVADAEAIEVEYDEISEEAPVSEERSGSERKVKINLLGDF